jgi:hypothetical protein
MYKNPVQCVEGSAETGEAIAVKSKNDHVPADSIRLPYKAWMKSREVVDANEGWMVTSLLVIYSFISIYYVVQLLYLHYLTYSAEAREDEGALDHVDEMARTMKFLRIAIIPMAANVYILFSQELMSTAVIPATIRRLNSSMFFWLFVLQVQVYETTRPSNIYFFPASKNLHEQNLLRCCGATKKEQQGIAPLKLFSAIINILLAVDVGYVGFGGRANDMLETLGWITCSFFGFIWLFVMVQTCRFIAEVIRQRRREQLSPNAENILKMRARAFYTIVSLNWAIISVFAQFVCIILLNIRSMMDMPGEWMSTNFVLCFFQSIHMLSICFGPLRNSIMIAIFLRNTTDRQLRVSSVQYILQKHNYYNLSEREQMLYPESVAVI